MKTPKPKHTATVCDVCGLDWKRHTDRMKTSGQKPTTDDCIALLRADLVAAANRPFTYPRPMPYRFPQPGPYYPPNMAPPFAQPQRTSITCQTSGYSGSLAHAH